MYNPEEQIAALNEGINIEQAGGSSTPFRRRKTSRKNKSAFNVEEGGFGVGSRINVRSEFPFQSVTRLQEGKQHIFTTGKELTNRDNVRCHGSFTRMIKIWKKINIYPQIRDPVVKIFGRFMDIELANSDNRCIHAIVERWWPTTHTFLFPNAEIGFTPLDFTMLTSISVGLNERSIPYDDRWSDKDMAAQYLPLIEDSHIRIGNVKISHLIQYFTDDYLRDHLDDLNSVAQIFVLYMLGNLFFTTTNDTVRLGYIEAIIDLEAAQYYDWGSSIMGYLYQSLDVAAVKGGHLTGFIELLQYWFFEYMTVCGYIVEENVKQASYPRLKAWERRNRKNTHDTASHLFSITRYHIDHRQAHHINWNPWSNSIAIDQIEVTVARNLSLRRLPLLVPPGEFYEFYLGERCVRQLSGEILIPMDPPLYMSRNMTYATYQEMQAALYPVDCHQFIYQGQDIDYDTYWKKIAADIGPLLDASVRIGNMDFFGPSALKSGIEAPIVMSSEVNYYSQLYPPPQETTWADDPGWNLQWACRDPIPIPHLPELPPVPSHYTVENLWEMNMGMRDLVLQESTYYEEGLDKINDTAHYFNMEVIRGKTLHLATKSTGRSKSFKKRKTIYQQSSDDDDGDDDDDEGDDDDDKGDDDDDEGDDDDDDGDDDEDGDDVDGNDDDGDDDSDGDGHVSRNKYGVRMMSPRSGQGRGSAPYEQSGGRGRSGQEGGGTSQGGNTSRSLEKGKQKTGGFVSRVKTMWRGGKSHTGSKNPGIEDL